MLVSAGFAFLRESVGIGVGAVVVATGMVMGMAMRMAMGMAMEGVQGVERVWRVLLHVLRIVLLVPAGAIARPRDDHKESGDG